MFCRFGVYFFVFLQRTYSVRYKYNMVETFLLTN